MNKTIDVIPSEIMTALVRYPWPGNVRELQSISLAMEELHIRTEAPSVRYRGSNKLLTTLEDAERQEIVAALEKSIGKVGGPNGAEAPLGMCRSTLLFRMQKLNITTSRAVASR
jgi:formate hydrogenlyase transcriptional activator